jgi:general secretion pathway protein G
VGNKISNRFAFTLIELIVVIAIIAVLAAIISPNAFRAIEKSKVTKAVADFKNIHQSCAALYADTGQWPGLNSSRLKLSELYVNPGWQGWDGPYLESSSDMHPWGGTIRFWTNWNWGRQLNMDLVLCYDRMNYDDSSLGHTIPAGSARKIDQNNDDGDLNAGDIRAFGSYYELSWLLEYDVL